MKARELGETLREFDNLPDIAVVSQRVAAMLLGVSARTLEKNTFGMQRVVLGRNVAFRVGEIRKKLGQHQS
jgi:hypothetical protein